jgi:Aspartyl protease
MTTRTAYFALLVSLVTPAGPLTANTPPIELPFKLHQGYLVVARGSIGHVAGVNFLIDTGSVPSMVDWTVARKLRLQTEARTLIAFGGTSRIGSATLPDIRLGPIHVRELPVGVGDLTFLRPGPIDAILGIDALGRVPVLHLDYEAHTLRFESDTDSDVSIPIELVWPFLTVRLAIDGQSVSLIVDTGSRDLILFRRRVEDRLPKLPVVGSKSLYLSSGELRLDKVQLPNVAAGARLWTRLTAFVSNAPTDGYPPHIDGVLGVRALGVRRLDLNLAARAMNWRE